MTKRELISALESSSVEDWAPVMVSVYAPIHDTKDFNIKGTVTTHTNKRQEILITLDYY